MAWYHSDISGLFLSFRGLNADVIGDIGWCHGILVRLTYHMPDVPGKWTYSTVRTFFTAVRLVAVKVVVNPLLHN